MMISSLVGEGNLTNVNQGVLCTEVIGLPKNFITVA